MSKTRKFGQIFKVLNFHVKGQFSILMADYRTLPEMGYKL